MCDKNINEISNILFDSTNDEFNWINNTANSIDTVGGQLVLRPDSSLSEFKRSLGIVDVTNNRLRIKSRLQILRPQGGADETFCATIGVFIGPLLIDEYSVYLQDLSEGSKTDYYFDRTYEYAIAGIASLRIKTPEGFGNEILLDYIKAEDFNYCSDDIRTYFVVQELFEESKTSSSSAFQLKEWKVDGVETLTIDFFSDNSTPGGNPINEWLFAKSKIDGLERIQEASSPNTFNPFSSELGLLFENITDNYFGGKTTGVTNGKDYGQGILNLGIDLPVILNRILEPRKGAFFIDIDYEKDLLVVFDVVINQSSSKVFDSPDLYRRYTIEYNNSTCECSYTYIDILNPSFQSYNAIEDGFLTGVSGVEINENIISCDENFQFNGASGTFELEIDFGTEVGQAGIDYNAFGVPEKFELEWNGQFFSTGYVGLSTFDQQLINSGVPVSEINTATPTNGAGTLLFNKDQAFPSMATLRVSAPLEGTAWTVSGKCPEIVFNSSLVEVGEGNCGSEPRVWNDVYISSNDPLSYDPQNGDVIYTDAALIVPFNGNDLTYRMKVSIPPIETVLEKQFEISSTGVISNVTVCNTQTGTGVQVTGNSSSDCYSCMTLVVDVPQGSSRQVVVAEDFEGSATWGSSFCSGIPGVVRPASNNTYNITERTIFVIGIDAAQTTGVNNTNTSRINVNVFNGSTLIDSKALTRSHSNGNC